MSGPGRISDTELNAFVDGELDDAAREEVAAWLETHPEDAARVAAYRRQNEAIRRHFETALDEPVPPRLEALVLDARRRARTGRWLRVAAAFLLLAVGGTGGWVLRAIQEDAPTATAPRYVEKALGAHLVYTAEVRHPVEVGAEQEAHLVAWLSKRLGARVNAPHLAAAGYELVGGRLLEDSGRPAAQFMYENAAGRRVTVFVRRYEGGSTAFRFVTRGDISAFYWIDAPLAYALAGALPRTELLALANLVYRELAPDEPSPAGPRRRSG